MGLSAAFGTFLAEGAMVCLELNNHSGEVILQVTGHFEKQFKLIWTDKLTESVKGSWKDKKEATEYGATAIALLVVSELTDYDFFERSIGGTDYILENKENPTEFSYLEISGLWKEGVGNTINMRVNLKKKQVKKAVEKHSTYIIVTEFGVPKTKIYKQ